MTAGRSPARWIGEGAGIEVGRDGVGDFAGAVNGDDVQSGAAVAGLSWETEDERGGDFNVGGREGREFAEQTAAAESGGQVGDAGSEGVFGAEIFLMKFLFAEGAAAELVGKKGERRAIEEQISEFDDRGLIAGRMVNVSGASVGRNEDEGNARAVGNGQAVGSVSVDRRGDVVVVPFGIVPGDDDGALGPVGACGDGVDGLSDESFADLGIGLARMVATTEKIALDFGVGVGRLEMEGIEAAALDEKKSAIERKGMRGESGEKIVHAVEFAAELGIVGDVAEVLRAVVVGDVAGVEAESVERAGIVGRFCGDVAVVAFLKPGEGNGGGVVRGKKGDVVVDVSEIARRVAVE